MFQSKPIPFEADVEKATCENNLSEDWSLIMQICDNAVNYSDGAKFCLKAIVKRLHHNVPRVVIQALTLLDSCVKNCDRRFLLQVASSEFTIEVRKLLAKMHPSTASKLKELLQKWSMEEFKDDPELCIIPALYYKLKSEGVEFPSPEKEKKPMAPICKDPDVVTSQEEENDIIKAIEISLKDTGRYPVPVDQGVSDFSSGSETKSMPEPFKVRAIYDFDAAEDNELTIKIGEIVLVSDNSNSSWWKGSNHRGEGLFPANFVTEDLDFKPEEAKIEVEATPVTETVSDISTEEVKINEEKIDTVLNWLNDVDPTEEISDPEDMLKLEKECSKMGPLIEEHLHAVDNRLAMLNQVNDEIMAAFDLFHDLSNKFSTLPTNMKLQSSTMQIPYAYHTMPSTMHQTQSNVPNPVTPVTVISPTSGSCHILSEQDSSKPNDNPQKQISNPYVSFPHAFVSHCPAAIPNASLTSAVASPPMNPIIHPGAMVSPYGAANMMGSIFIPPGVPIPFPTNVQQAGYPGPGATQNYMSMPYAVPSVSPYMHYPYYYLNNTPAPAPQQDNISTTSPNNQTMSVTLSTSTSVSNVLSPTPLPSVSSYYNELQQISSIEPSSVSTDQTLKQDRIQNPSVQASGDGQTSTSTSSSSENL